MTSTATIDRLIQQVGELYSLPAVALELLELTRDPAVNARQLKQCIERDPALVSKILRTVNSSLFGLRQEVSNLTQALALLGVKPLKLLVLGFSLPTQLYEDLAPHVLERYWRRTLVKAVSARQICESFWHEQGDEAFTAGLLQDLGQLVLAQQLGAPFLRLLEHAERSGRDLGELEIQALGFDDHELTSCLMESWRLPELLVLAVRSPSVLSDGTPLDRNTRMLCEVVHLAGLVSGVIVDLQPAALGALLDYSARYCQATRAEVDTLIAGLQHTVEQLADVFSLSLPAGHDFASTLAEAHRQLTEVAAEAACELANANQPNEATKPQLDTNLQSDIQQLSEAAQRWHTNTRSGIERRKSPPPFVAHHSDTAAHAPAGRGSASSTKPLLEPNAKIWNAETTRPSHLGIGSDQVAADPVLVARLQAAGSTCRGARQPLSLILAEFEHHTSFIVAHGGDPYEKLVERLVALASELGAPLRLSDTTLAVILSQTDRRQAVEIGHQLVREVQRFASGLRDKNLAGLALAVGVASVSVPPRNFSAKELSDAAGRCVHGAWAMGGGNVKSIELY